MVSLFQKLIVDMSSYNSTVFLVNNNEFQKKFPKVKLRYQIIAEAFHNKLSYEQLTHELVANGCEKLYSRNYTEASLIYAFSNHLSFEDWQRIQHINQSLAATHTQKDFFDGSRITLHDLKRYVAENSVQKDSQFQTRHLTQHLEKKLSELPNDDKHYQLFLRENIMLFSCVREKARYYYCKYLCSYIEQKIHDYINIVKKQQPSEDALSELLILKGLTTLKRKKMTSEEIIDFLNNAPISCGNLYDEFNFFYFNYISSDWMEVLLDFYGKDIRKLSPKDKKALANSLRIYNPKWKKKTDDEILQCKWEEIERQEEILNTIYSRNGTTKGYQRNRSGEKSIRNYISGKLDIDRTTLICSLIFFTSKSPSRISLQRINEILTECGYVPLRSSDSFDTFIIQYMTTDDPVDYLMEEVTRYAFENKNFFLYHMYNESVSIEDEWQRIIMPRYT